MASGFLGLDGVLGEWQLVVWLVGGAVGVD